MGLIILIFIKSIKHIVSSGWYVVKDIKRNINYSLNSKKFQ